MILSSTYRSSRQEARVNSQVLTRKNLQALARVYEVDPLEDGRWQSLVERHPHASIFHHVGWLNALYLTYGYEPVVLTTSRPTSDLENGMLFCRIRSWVTGKRIVSLPFSDHCAFLCEPDEKFESLIWHLHTARVGQRWKYLELRPVSRNFEEAVQELGFKPAAKYVLHRVDLEPAVEEIFRRLDKDSIQRRVRHSERVGIVEISGNSQGLLRDFYQLLVRTRARHDLPPQPYAWFSNLLNCMGEAVDLRVAYMKNVPVAAVWVFHFKSKSYYKYGCSDERFHKLGAMPFLLWRAILNAKSIGSKTFDLGRTGEDHHGLIAFKNHWTPVSESLTYWKFPSHGSITFFEDWKRGMVKRVCSHVPNRLLQAVGAWLYRHAG
jgi:GNAT acetyltransferase-like protein